MLPRATLENAAGMLLLAISMFGLCACAVDAGSQSAVREASTAPTTEPTLGSSDTWSVDFEANFEGLAGLPDLPGSPGLPEALFAQDGSQWTQLQISHPEANLVELRNHDRDRQTGTVLACSASGQPDGVASKADLGRQGFSYGAGSQVRITVDVFLDPGSDEVVMRDNTLIDLEDNDDLFVEGESPGAGLRLLLDGEGRLTLDRGEVPGREQPGVAPVARLSTLRSDYVAPVRQWITIEMTLRLGVDAATSAEAIDPETRDEPAWVEVAVSSQGVSQTVLAMAGTNVLDPVAVREVFEELDPNAEVTIPDQIDYDSLQVCATNNRSGTDVLITVDNLIVESRSAN